MNLLVVTWSMISAACAVLGLIQLFLWAHNRRGWVYPLSAVMAFSAAAVALLEMFLFSSPELARHEQLLVWLNLAIVMVLVPMVWSVKEYLPSARTWAAALISAIWCIGLLVNFFLPGNLTFTEIQSVDQRMTFWGDTFYVPKGSINPWKWLVDLTVILIPLYMIDAAWRASDPKRGIRGIVITVGVVLFVLFAGGHAMLVDSGVINSPYMVSAAFLSIVFTLTWVYARDAVRARILALEVAQAQRETERLMRTNLLGEVAAALAHELNQPLTAILGNAQAAEKFLTRVEPDLDEIRDILADIVRDDKRARDIIINMRRMLSGDGVAEELLYLESAIREVIDMVSKELDHNGITVQLEKTGKTPEVAGNRVALQQVVLNLVLNAEYAIRESQSSVREIQIYLTESKGGAEIEVRDSGPGIAEEVRQQLFTPFVTTRADGLGLGLVVCRRIVEAQGGRMTAENLRDGGASFRIWLPAGQH